MYYINNKTYVCHVVDLINCISDISSKRFTKRKVVFIKETEWETIILEGSLKTALEDNAIPFVFSHDWKGASSNGEKNIVCFFDAEKMGARVLSYYLEVANLLGLSSPADTVNATYPQLSSLNGSDDTFSLEEENAKGIPVNLMISALNQGESIGTFKDFFVDKVNSSKESIVISEFRHIVFDNFLETNYDFQGNEEVMGAITTLRATKTRDSLTISDWHAFYPLIVKHYPLDALPNVEIILDDYLEYGPFLDHSGIGEMRLVNAILETDTSDPSFMALYYSAVQDNCRYFRDLAVRTNFIDVSAGN